MTSNSAGGSGSTFCVLSEGGLRVRTSPSTDANATGILQKGLIVTALETKGDWIKHPDGWSLIKSGDKTFLKACSAKWQVLSPGGLRVRNAPDGDPIGVLPTSSVVQALQMLEIGTTIWIKHAQGWSMVGSNGKVFLTDHVIPPWQGQGPSVWKVQSEGGLRIRAAPSLSATAFGILPKDTLVTVLERKEDWIRHEKGWSLIQAKGKMFLSEVNTNGDTSKSNASKSSESDRKERKPDKTDAGDDSYQ